MAKRDYYETLGVSRDVSDKDLKSAYRNLAMQYHPDRNPNNKDAEQKFKNINEAYDILKDPQKRAAYDRMGHAAFDGTGGFGGATRSGFSGMGSFSDIFEDVFSDVFGGTAGGGRSRKQASRGADLRYNMEITLEESFSGVTREISINASEGCQSCNGTGSQDGSLSICSQCSGSGRIRTQSGIFMMERVCVSCGGSGQIISNPCTNCHGDGRVKTDKVLSVNIPRGVEDGMRIRLEKRGEAGTRGGAPGDLYIFMSIVPHRFFQREGKNIYCDVPISMVAAALGGEIEVPVIDGSRACLKIPVGTQSGRQFRLRGKGMTVLRHNSRGDMYVKIHVETPINLSKRQKEILKEFSDENTDCSPQSKGFFAKVKDFLP